MREKIISQSRLVHFLLVIIKKSTYESEYEGGDFTSLFVLATSPTMGTGVYPVEFPKPPLLPNEGFPPFLASSIFCLCSSFAFSRILFLASLS